MRNVHLAQARNGDTVSVPLLEHAVKTEHWYYLTRIDVETKGARSGAIVAFADSTTDGHGSTSNGSNLDQRRTDHLARKTSVQRRHAGGDIGALGGVAVEPVLSAYSSFVERAHTHDQANPTQLQASYQRDRLHPTAELYRAIADSIDTTLFH